MFAWIFLGIIYIIIIVMILILIKGNKKKAKEYWLEHDHTKAEVIYIKKSTPLKGMKTIVVNPHKWVIIDWNVKENKLEIWEPKHTYKTPNEYKLGNTTMNWKLLVHKKKINIEDYFSRTRIR